MRVRSVFNSFFHRIYNKCIVFFSIIDAKTTVLNVQSLIKSVKVGNKTSAKNMSKLFTLEEIKSQNGKNGAKTWIVLHDNVYDVTDYLQDVIPYFFSFASL